MDQVTLIIILSADYKLWGSSLCNFIHPPAIISLEVHVSPQHPVLSQHMVPGSSVKS